MRVVQYNVPLKQSLVTCFNVKRLQFGHVIFTILAMNGD